MSLISPASAPALTFTVTFAKQCPLALSAELRTAEAVHKRVGHGADVGAVVGELQKEALHPGERGIFVQLQGLSENEDDQVRQVADHEHGSDHSEDTVHLGGDALASAFSHGDH